MAVAVGLTVVVFRLHQDTIAIGAGVLDENPPQTFDAPVSQQEAANRAPGRPESSTANLAATRMEPPPPAMPPVAPRQESSPAPLSPPLLFSAQSEFAASVATEPPNSSFSQQRPVPVGPSPFLEAQSVVLHHPNRSEEFEVNSAVRVPTIFLPPRTASSVGLGNTSAPSRVQMPPDIGATASQIADDFLQNVTVPPGEPPLTDEEWDAAAELANERYRSRIGWEAYNARVLEAAKERLRATR